jgi:hypothetical protein
MKHYRVGLSFGLLGVVLLAPITNAQGRGPAGTFSHATTRLQHLPFPQAPGRASFHGRYAHMPRRHRIYPYSGFGPYFYYPDFDYDTDPPEQPPQPARSTPQPGTAAETPRPADSVVMELRGDRWVRLTATGPVEVMAPAPAAARATVLPAFDQSPPRQPLPAAILVFRDGHQEEAAKYTIVDRNIFLRSDYYATGFWTRKVPIRDLDVSATLKLNAERGTKFTLPSRPSEIVLRP